MSKKLKVKIALLSSLSDQEIASFAELKKVKQVYFLKQELAKISLERLTFICKSLLNMQSQLNRGQKDIALSVQLHLLAI